MATEQTSDLPAEPILLDDLQNLPDLPDASAPAVTLEEAAVIEELADRRAREHAAVAGKPAPDPELEAAMTAVDFADLSDAQLAALESGDQEKIAEALNVPEAGAPTRISLKAIADPQERRALADATRLVRDGKHATLRSALAEVMGLTIDAETNPGSTADAPNKGFGNGEPADPFGDPPPAPGEAGAFAASPPVMPAQLTALETESDAARTYFDFEQAARLRDQVSDMRQGLRAARLHEEERLANEAVWEEVESDSRQRAIAAYPDLGRPETEFARLVDDEIVLAEHRYPELLNSPDWPEQIAARVNEKHGNRFGGGTAEPGWATASHAVPRPPPRAGVRLPGSPMGAGAHTSSLTVQTALAELDRLPLEDQDAVLTQMDIIHQRRSRGRGN